MNLTTQSHRRTIRLTLSLFVVLTLAICWPLPGVNAEDDVTFREFPDGEVASPPELFRSLIELSIDVPDSLKRRGHSETRGGPVEPGESASTPPTRSFAQRLTNPYKFPNPGELKRDNPASRKPDSRAEFVKRIREAVGRAERRESQRNGSESPDRQQPVTASLGPEQRQRGALSGDSSEGFRDRMNRILLSAAERSLAGKGQEGASKLNMLERSFRRLADSAKEHLDKRNPKWRKRLGRKLEHLDERLVRSTRESVSFLQGGSASGTAATGPDRLFPWLLVAAGLVMAVIAGFVWRRFVPRIAERPQSLIRKLQITLKPIDSRGDLILSVDRFLNWSLGKRSDSWNCQIVKQSLVAAYPAFTAQISRLVDDYEVARYAPESVEFSKSQLQRCASTLRQLVSKDAADTNL